MERILYFWYREKCYKSDAKESKKTSYWFLQITQFPVISGIIDHAGFFILDI